MTITDNNAKLRITGGKICERIVLWRSSSVEISGGQADWIWFISLGEMAAWKDESATLYLKGYDFRINGQPYESGTLINKGEKTSYHGDKYSEYTISGFLQDGNFISTWINVFDDCKIVIVPPIQAGVDIRPGVCPNPVNIKSKGILPVAILGANDLDVNMIDVNSIRLEGVAPIRSSLVDVNNIVEDPNECVCSNGVNGLDGKLDLLLKFDTQEILDAMGYVYNGLELDLAFTGVLKDGSRLKGTDCILIRAC